jgi:cell division protein FtsL
MEIKQRGPKMFYACAFLTLAMLAATFFFYQVDNKSADDKIQEKESFAVMTEKSFEQLKESDAKIIAGIVDLEKVVQSLRENVGAKLSEQERTNQAIDSEIKDLNLRTLKTELDVGTFKNKRPVIRVEGNIPVSIVNRTPTQASPTGPKKNLGKGIGAMINEGAGK